MDMEDTLWLETKSRRDFEYPIEITLLASK